jgi:hypothetical protein
MCSHLAVRSLECWRNKNRFRKVLLCQQIMLIEGLISEILDFSGEIFFFGTVLKYREAQKRDISHDAMFPSHF